MSSRMDMAETDRLAEFDEMDVDELLQTFFEPIGPEYDYLLITKEGESVAVYSYLDSSYGEREYRNPSTGEKYWLGNGIEIEFLVDIINRNSEDNEIAIPAGTIYRASINVVYELLRKCGYIVG